jgi:hypothetical protein
MSDQSDRRTRAITAGLSATGAAAGVGGLAYAAHDAVNTTRAGKKIPLKTKALIPLEVAGLTGEVMATKILHSDAKKKSVVKAMSRMDMDPKNGKGRRIVVENAESDAENKEENSVPVTRKKLLAMAAEVKNGASMKSEVDKAFDRYPHVRGSEMTMYANGRSYSPDTYYVIDNGRTALLRRPKVIANVEPNGKTLGRAASQALKEKSDVYAGVRQRKYSLEERRELAELARRKPSKAKHRGYDAHINGGEVGKARYFDPEADRQRRLGLYSGAALGGAIAAGSVAHSQGDFGFEREAGDAAKKMSPKYTLRANRKGVAAAGASLGLAALAAGTYKRGVSHRNQPWN